MTDLRSRLKKIWANARFRIVFWAAFTGIICGVSDVGLPVEDALSNVRNHLRLQPSNGEIGMVLQDAETLERLGVMDVSRANDAVVVENLFKAGAKRVFFDRALSYYDSQTGNDEFIRVLQK